VSEPEHCPACGEPSGPGQLVCLRCGGRLTLTRPRPDRWRPLTVFALALVAFGGIAVGFGLSELIDGTDGDQSSQTDAAQQAAARERQRVAAARRDRLAEQRQAHARAQREARSGSWPANLTAYTVVLVTASDEASARQTADTAKTNGVEAGVLHSDDYGLGQGFWIVYAGTYDNQDAASAEASELAASYPGAYPQLIEANN
jgi:predicted nucleic acid-binding Zn ribbon protein